MNTCFELLLVNGVLAVCQKSKIHPLYVYSCSEYFAFNVISKYKRVITIFLAYILYDESQKNEMDFNHLVLI